MRNYDLWNAVESAAEAALYMVNYLAIDQRPKKKAFDPLVEQLIMEAVKEHARATVSLLKSAQRMQARRS